MMDATSGAGTAYPSAARPFVLFLLAIVYSVLL